jgi:hypothetical protein
MITAALAIGLAVCQAGCAASFDEAIAEYRNGRG